MKRKKKQIWAVLLLAMLMTCLLPIEKETAYAAARSYTNAREFYDSTGEKDGKHIEINEGVIYFATKAKLASSSTNLRYVTVGFDVTLTGNGNNVNFSVKRGGSLEEVPNSKVTYGGYEYLLYHIPTSSLRTLALSTGNANTATVLSATKIMVQMDAIITTINGTTVNGSVVENGSGGLIETGTIYHLGNPSHKNTVLGIFTSKFDGYTEITDYLDNTKLTVLYDIENAKLNNSNFSTSVFSIDSTTTLQHALVQSGAVVKDGSYLAQTFTLKNPHVAGLNLTRTGYHLDTGEEWKKNSTGEVFSASRTYEPKELESTAGQGNKTVILYPNWKLNNFTISYNANGGTGAMVDTSVDYGRITATRQIAFSKKGHTFNGWHLYRASDNKWLYTNGSSTNWYAENAAPSGYYKKAYASGATVSNETDVHGDTITFYAQWSPNLYTITLDNQGAETAGTTAYYELYSKGNYTTSACSSTIATITKPTKKGHTFEGYYTGKDGTGTQYINASGTITATNTTFDVNTTLYAKWRANQYTIIYNSNKGSGAMSNTVAVYGTSASLRTNAYTRTGYNFIGWSTSKAATTATYADRQSVINLRENDGDSITLYAVWEPIVVSVIVDSQGGTGGTGTFYEKYENGFYTDENCTTNSAISSITVPTKKGYTLQGFWDTVGGKGTQIINSLGAFLKGNTYFLYNTTIFADWKANTYTVTFDKQGGTGGTDSAPVTYDKLFPMKDANGMAVEAPIREGYRFMGYFKGKNGVDQVYNEFMATDEIYQSESNTTLYAHWIDDILPEVELNVSSNVWTKYEVTLTAKAKDYGIGLSSVVIYQIEQDGKETAVASATNLNGTKYKELTFVNKKEGVIRYKAVATDMSGNSVESYNVVYYDKTAPVGEVVDVTINGNEFTFEIDVTDMNNGK